MKHLFLALLSFAAASCTAYSQDSSATAATSNVTVGLSLISNADYYGQRSQEKMPYTSFVASYRHHSGFFMNALAYRLLNNESSGFASAYGAGLGFDIGLSKGWNAEIGYQYTFFPKHSPFLQAANPHSATAALSWENAVTIKLEGNYNFGITNDFFSTLSASKQISLFSISEKDVVIFTPQLDVTAGTQKFYNYYIKEKTIRDSLAGRILGPIFGQGNETAADTTIQKVTSFDPLSYNLKLPIGYSRSNYLIELAAQLSLLSNKAQVQPGKLNTFLSASFYYQF